MLFVRLSLLFLFACFSCSLVNAQPYIDLLNARAEYFPGHMDAGENTDSLSTTNYAARFLLPLQRKNEDVVLISGNFGLLRFHYAGFEPNRADLYTLRLAAGYNRLWKNKKWRTLLLALPKINSDMKQGTTDDFQMGGLAQCIWLKSDSLKFRFAVYYNREFFGNYFVLLAGLDWKINSRFHLFGDLPSALNLEYKASSKLYLGLAFQSVVATYRLNSGNYVREGKEFWGYEQLKAFFNFHLSEHVVWFGEVGHTYGREYRLFNPQNEELKPLPVFGRDLDGMVFNTGVAYRIRLDEKN